MGGNIYKEKPYKEGDGESMDTSMAEEVCGVPEGHWVGIML